VKSWKTTLFGVCTILSALSGVGISLLDGNPATNPDWSVVVTACITGFGLIFARDNNKSSEDVGIK
jgi:ABC-type Mn2+/Zn2+ transport system permease subunit